MLIGPPSEIPNRAARSDPAASMTARTSSTRCSRVGTSLTGSDRPVPRLSKTLGRAHPAARSGQARAGFAEEERARERADALEEARERRRLPLKLEVGGEA